LKVLLTGSDGQVGKQIIISAPKNINLIRLTRKHLDLTNFDSCFETIIDQKPDWIINAGAYTNVDGAELNKELAIETNANSTLAFSKALKITGGKLLQLSTDFVFDGNQKIPYANDQIKNPINYYGYTKALAEENIIKTFESKKQFLILRTSWVLGPVGKNFLLTMISLNQTKKIIKVVNDQIGSITSTISLADTCWKLVEKYKDNIFHSRNSSILHFTNKGQASWYEVAKFIGESALENRLISKSAEIRPIKSSQYKTLAIRPSYSVLDCSETYKILKYEPPNWENAIIEIIKNLKS